MTTPPELPSWVLFVTELRQRLIKACLFFLAVLLITVWFANPLYDFLSSPLLRYVPAGHLIATEIASPFFVPFRLACSVAFAISFPVFLYQLWLFVAPALYGNERKWSWLLLALSVILFYVGAAFCFFISLPLLFQFLSQTVPLHVTMTPDISHYLDFVLNLILIFGFLFEIPLLMLVLSSARWVAPSTWQAYRSYAWVGAFIVGMMLAPPDVFSQTIVALPICILYESGLWLSKWISYKNLIN